MTFPLSDLMQARPALAVLAKERLPLPLALRVARIVSQVDVAISGFERERQALLLACATRDSDGNVVTESHEDGRVTYPLKEGNDFGERLSDLLAQSVAVKFAPLLMEEFPEGMAVSAEVLIKLGGLVAE